MKKMRIRNSLKQEEADILEQDLDVYSEEFDDEAAFDRGMKAHEIAFLRGFRKFN